jgi:hypothetical protein
MAVLLMSDIDNIDNIDESHICEECGGLLCFDDSELPQYAGFDYCGCHLTRPVQVSLERGNIFLTSKDDKL